MRERNERTNQAQFEIMVEFMEQNGDLSTISSTKGNRIVHFQKWKELTAMLNNRLVGKPKTLSKWRKTWSDFKSKTQVKLQNGSVKFTQLEKRLLMLIGQKGIKRRVCPDPDPELEADNADVDPLTIKDVVIEGSHSISPSRLLPHPEPEYSQHHNSSVFSEEATAEDCTPAKMMKNLDSQSDLKDTIQRFIELEKERAKMAHERELARIKQNDKLLHMIGRMVDVLESVAPSLQRYLDGVDNAFVNI